MRIAEDHAVIDFYRYPPIGADDWRYAYSAARVRVLESMMLARAVFVDMANAADFAQAAELISATEYAISATATGNADIENMLIERRTESRNTFMALMLDEEIANLLRAREDFANMRLAVRRVVTGRKLGLEYSNEGSVPAEQFEEIFEQENYELLPDYLQEAVEEAILGYYENKDIRRIDYAIDRVRALYRVRRAGEIGSVFCLSYFRTDIDLTNIRTMLRLKMAERDDRELFLPGGFVETGRFIQGIDTGYESLAQVFYATPYYELLEEGIRYLTSEKSFLAMERVCQEHITGFLKTTSNITAGPQPVIAYLLMKEAEIRTVRLLLTAKMNRLEPALILDRLGGR